MAERRTVLYDFYAATFREMVETGAEAGEYEDRLLSGDRQNPENARIRAEYWEGEERPEPARRPAARIPAGARANASRNST